MNKTINIRKGLNIRLKGSAEKVVKDKIRSKYYSIRPIDFPSLTPKLVLKPENTVKRGETVFIDKYNPSVCFVSPVSGTIKEVVRGDKRKILEIIIESDDNDSLVKADISKFDELPRDEKIDQLLKAGIWPYFIQRPYGIIANPNDNPRDIFISFFDSGPLAPDFDFILSDKKKEINTALNFISELTKGKVYLNFEEGSKLVDLIENKDKFEIHFFSGPHPSGLPGTHINKINPINKGEIIWTVNAADLPIIGHFINTGEYLPERIFALAGSEVISPYYYKALAGTDLEELIISNTKAGEKRLISGNVLTGTNISDRNFLGFFDKLVSVIPEGNKHEMMGWAMPGINKLSAGNTFLSKLIPNKVFAPDTNYYGGHRALVVTGQYEKVCPLDIYPQVLLKSVMVEDIDKMEQLGIYEIIEEDMALCEFVCTSKTEIQEIIRDGIDLMIKETS